VRPLDRFGRSTFSISGEARSSALGIEDGLTYDPTTPYLAIGFEANVADRKPPYSHELDGFPTIALPPLLVEISRR
jgi:hypothetical protein